MHFLPDRGDQHRVPSEITPREAWLSRRQWLAAAALGGSGLVQAQTRGPGRLPALLKRFEAVTLKLWDKHNIRQVGFWTTVIGEDNQLLYYVLEWKDLAERERAWAAFQADPDWHKARAEKIGRAHV